VALEIPRTVFALSIWAIHWFVINTSAGCDCPLEVLVYIIHKHDKTGACYADSTRRADFMLFRDTMQPDWSISGANFRVCRAALVVSGNSARLKPKRLDEKIMRRGQIFVNEERNNTIDIGH